MSFATTNKFLSVLCAVLMVSVVFQNASAGGNNNGKHVDIFYDMEGNQHKIWRDDVDGIMQVFYANNIGDNNTGIGHGGIQVTYSPVDVQYPQIAIDPISNICYILWIVEGETSEEFWYCGSDDLYSWTDGRYGDIFPGTNGNPCLDMYAHDFMLYVSWKHCGSLTIIPDIDGDFIVDSEDPNPFTFNIFGDNEFEADVFTTDDELKISVAIDYADNTVDYEKPLIALGDEAGFDGSIGNSIEISLDTDENFIAAVKIIYEEGEVVSNGLTEKYLRAYTVKDLPWFWNWTEWRILMNDELDEFTDVDVNNDTVWFITTHFSTFIIADSTTVDSDDDGLTDAEEINADETSLYTIVDTFADDSTAKELTFADAGKEIIYINIPESDASILRAESAFLTLDSTSSAHPQDLTNADSFPPSDSSICIDSNNNYHVIWTEKESPQIEHLMYIKSTDFGVSWSTPTSLFISYPSTVPMTPSIACDGENVGIVFIKTLGVTKEVNLIYSKDEGVTWTGPINLSPPNELEAEYPSIDWQGNTAFVVYKTDPLDVQPGDEFRGIAYRTFQEEPGLVEELFYTEGTGIPKITVDDGDIHVVFCVPDTDDPDVYKKLIYLHGSLFTKSFDEPVILASYELDGVAFNKYSFDVDSRDGNVALVWQNYEIGSKNYNLVLKRSFDHGGRWQSDIKLTDDPDNSLYPTCVFDSNINLHIAWQSGQITSEIKYKIINSLNAVLYEEDFAVDDFRSLFPSGAIDSTNNYHFVFTKEHGSSVDISYNSVRFLPELSVKIDDQEDFDWSPQENSLYVNLITTPDFSIALNKYLKDHEDIDDGNEDGFISVPICITTYESGIISVTDPLVAIYVVETDPVDYDTDDDALGDGQERNILTTDPTLYDTDGDGLSDYDEIMGTFGFKSDPLVADTDGNGYPDLYEVNGLIISDSEITTFTDGSDNQEVIFTEEGGGSAIVTFDLPINTDAMEYVYDAEFLLTGESYTLTNPIEYDHRIALSDNLVIWSDIRNSNDYDIYAFDLVTGTETQLTDDPEASIQDHDEVEPAVYGDIIVWTDYVDGIGNIYYYDPSIGIEPITSNSYNDFDPSIYGDYVVWTREIDNQLDVMLCDITTKAVSTLVDNSHNQFEPKIWGNNVVWTDTRNGNRDIYMYDLGTSTEVQITTDLNDQDMPCIYDNKIVWRDNRHPASGQTGLNWEIYSMDIGGVEERTTNSEYVHEVSPVIWEGGTAWTAYDGSKFNIAYDDGMATIPLTSSNDNVYCAVYGSNIAWIEFSASGSKLQIYNTGDFVTAHINDITLIGNDYYELDGEGIPSTVMEYRWFSNRDGLIGTSAICDTIIPLSRGTHEISFVVRGENGLWSTPDVQTLIVANEAPTATIISITYQEGENNVFEGSGSDPEGSPLEYRWLSNLDGFLSSDPVFTPVLSSGDHTIYFSVRDDAGAWSNVEEYDLVVSEPSATSGSVTTGDLWHSDYPHEMSLKITAEAGKSITFTVNGNERKVSDEGTYHYVGFLSSVNVISVSGSSSTFVLTSGITDTYSGRIGPDVSTNAGVFWESDIPREVTVKIKDTGDRNCWIDAGPGSRYVSGYGTYYYVGQTDTVEALYCPSWYQAEYTITIGVLESYMGIIGVDVSTGAGIFWESDTLLDKQISIIANSGSFDVTASDGASQTVTQSTPFNHRGIINSISVYYYYGSDDGTYSIDEPSYDSDSSADETETTKGNTDSGAILSNSNTITNAIIPSERPVAVIDTITPQPARVGEFIALIGHGEGKDGKVITAWNWRSSQDGDLGSGETVPEITLSENTHIIYYKVMDETGLWSDEVGLVLVVKPNNAPVSEIIFPPDGSSIVRTFDYLESIPFEGTGQDIDGDLLTYEWSFGTEEDHFGALYEYAFVNTGRDIFQYATVLVTLVVSDGISEHEDTVEIYIKTPNTPNPPLTYDSMVQISGIYEDTESWCEWPYIDVLMDGEDDWHYDETYQTSNLISMRKAINLFLIDYHVQDGTIQINIEITSITPGRLVLSNLYVHEVILSLNPSDEDTDQDGLTDVFEATFFGTDPTSPDTDGDLLSDFVEYGFNSDPHLEDTDSDGLNDYLEHQYGTLPRDPDSDNDKFDDGEEITYWKTDPLNPDTDGDDIKDGNEPGKPYHTSPILWDTDGDGVSDNNDAFPKDVQRNKWQCDIGFRDANTVYPRFEEYDERNMHVPGVCIITSEWGPAEVHQAVNTYREWDSSDSTIYLNIYDKGGYSTMSVDTAYLITVRYRAENPVDVRQYMGPAKPHEILKTLPATGIGVTDDWDTISFISIKDYYDALGASQDHVNVRFDFTGSIQLGAISARPILDFYLDANPVDSNSNSIPDNEEAQFHTPGAYFVPGGADNDPWIDVFIASKYGKRCGFGEPGSWIGLTELNPNVDYLVTVEYLFSDDSPSGYAELLVPTSTPGDWQTLMEIPRTYVLQKEKITFVINNADDCYSTYAEYFPLRFYVEDSANAYMYVFEVSFKPFYYRFDIGDEDDIYTENLKPGISIRDSSYWDIITEDLRTARYGDTDCEFFLNSPLPGQGYRVTIDYKSITDVAVEVFHDGNYEVLPGNHVDYNPLTLYALPASGTTWENAVWDSYTFYILRDDYTDYSSSAGETTFEINVQLRFTEEIIVDSFVLLEDKDEDNDGLTDYEEEHVIGTLPNEWDTDGDDIPDGWEAHYMNGEIDPLTWDKYNDPDTDLLTNFDEYNAGTDPWNPDTDGDGLTDDLDYAYANPNVYDTDGDGLNDYDEYYGMDGLDATGDETNPFVTDTDGDGISDGNEVFNRFTLPYTWDSDGDGLADGLTRDIPGQGMKIGEETIETNPLLADSDWDGMNDLDEYNEFLNLGISIFEDFDNDGLNNGPNDYDTDGDGLADAIELEGYDTFAILTRADLGTYAVALNDTGQIDMNAITTEFVIPDVLNPDTDGDGLNDLEEYMLRSNPLEWDTDEDGLDDAYDDDPTVVELNPPTMEVYYHESFPGGGAVKRVHVQVYIRDDTGIDSFMAYKNGEALWEDPIWWGGSPKNVYYPFYFDIWLQDVFDGVRLDMEVFDIHGNVGETYGVQKTLFEAAAEFVSTWIAPFLGPQVGGVLSGAIWGMHGALSDIITLITNPGSLLDAADMLADTMLDGPMSIFDMIGNMIAGIDATQLKYNPYTTGSSNFNTFKFWWYIGYVAVMIAVDYAITAGVAAGAQAVMKGLDVGTMATKIVGAAQKVQGKVGDLIDWGRKACSAYKAHKYLYTAGIMASAYGAALAWPEIFGDWFKLGFGAVFMSMQVADFIPVLDDLPTRYAIPEPSINKVKGLMENPSVLDDFPRIIREHLDDAGSVMDENDFIRLVDEFDEIMDITDNRMRPKELAEIMDDWKTKNPDKGTILDPSAGSDQLLKMWRSGDGKLRILEFGDDGHGWQHIWKKHVTGEIPGGSTFSEVLGISDEATIKNIIDDTLKNGDANPRYGDWVDYTYPHPDYGGQIIEVSINHEGKVWSAYPKTRP